MTCHKSHRETPNLPLTWSAASSEIEAPPHSPLHVTRHSAGDQSTPHRAT